MIGASVEDLLMARNGGNKATRSEASLVKEFNGYETTGMMSEQEEGSEQVQNINEAFSEEEHVVMEGGHALMIKEDNLLHEDVSGQGGVNGVSGQDDEGSRRINLGDPSSFPSLNSGQAPASPLRAEGVVNVESFSSSSKKNNGSARMEAGP